MSRLLSLFAVLAVTSLAQSHNPKNQNAVFEAQKAEMVVQTGHSDSAASFALSPDETILAGPVLSQNPAARDTGSYIYSKEDASSKIPLPPDSGVWSVERFQWQGITPSQIGLHLVRESPSPPLHLFVKSSQLQQSCAEIYARLGREKETKDLHVVRFPARWEKPGVLVEVGRPSDPEAQSFVVLCRPAGKVSYSAVITMNQHLRPYLEAELEFFDSTVPVLAALGDFYEALPPVQAAPLPPANSAKRLEVEITDNGKPVENARVLLTHGDTRQLFWVKTDKYGRGAVNMPLGDLEVEIVSATGEILYRDKRTVTGRGDASWALLVIDVTKDVVKDK